jgi:predicted TIM-barrel fold metal-dependent hydrolase
MMRLLSHHSVGTPVEQMTRRDLLKRAAAVAATAASTRLFAGEHPAFPIIDAHVHVWDLKQFDLPWLDHNPLLHRDFSVADYRKAAQGLNVQSAVYVEVNVAPQQQRAEAEYVAELCDQAKPLFVAGVIGGDPRDPGFAAYLDDFKNRRGTRGVRCYYPKGASADEAFLRGMRALAERGLSFDLQLGPELLADAARTVQACPETRFILNHCGGASPAPFRREAENDAQARHARETWRQGIAAIARHKNVSCKISGVADSALPGDATAADVAPMVNFCLDHFGPDRVLFGGNWPVCLKGLSLAHLIEALREVVSPRSETDQRKLFHDNASRVYLNRSGRD